MNLRILTTRISATSLVLLRDRARQVGELFGLDKLQRTRLITAISEIARNTVQYAGEGTATFLFDSGKAGMGGQQVIVQMADKGPGIAGLDQVPAGRLNSQGQIPLGIAGSRRLVDALRIECPPEGGTLVTLSMALPRSAVPLSRGDIAARVEQLAARKPQTPLEELEQINRDMLQVLDELRLRQLELVQADERKNQFLATLAHELRNPLATLHMTLELMRRQPDIGADDMARRREVMARQTVQLTRLVDDLMDVSRVSRGKVELDRKPTEVNELVSQAVEMTGAAIAAKAHDVDLRLNGAPLWIQGDKARLQQVLCNLIQNAARYTPPNGKITVSVRREASYAVVDVADNGIGIAADVLPSVFEMFVQAGTAAGGHSQGGLGVGLTLVQRLTEDHGGTVTASSAGLGHGSCFTVALPLSSVPAAQSALVH